MNEYFIHIDVTKATGTQLFSVFANSKEEAIKLYNEGKAEFLGEELYPETTKLGKVEQVDE